MHGGTVRRGAWRFVSLATGEPSQHAHSGFIADGGIVEAMQERHEHDLGLAHDLTVLSRRRMFRLAGAAGASALVAACARSGTEPTAGPTSTATTTAGTAHAAACATAARAETAGPYPSDGSNGPNVLIESGIVRSDIRSSFGSYSGTAEGVPVTIDLTLQDLTKNCAAGAGMAVYIWHCDRSGDYSLYSQAAADQNYLRGVQVTDQNGRVSFTSIFRLLRRPVAAHPLRAVRLARSRRRRRKRPAHFANRLAGTVVHRRVRIRHRLLGQCAEHVRRHAGLGQRLRRRLGRRTCQCHRRSGQRHDHRTRDRRR
jgi:protocatechuate 3,4-dioxygenase beta subunit